jgi:hypothetical protein
MTVGTQVAKILDAVVLEVTVDVVDLQRERKSAPSSVKPTPHTFIGDAGFFESTPKQGALHAEASRWSPDEDLLRSESETMRAILVADEV